MMNDNIYKKIVLLGGDRRQASVARCMVGSAEIYVHGIPEDIINDKRVICTDDIEKALKNASAVVLPFSKSSRLYTAF